MFCCEKCKENQDKWETVRNHAGAGGRPPREIWVRDPNSPPFEKGESITTLLKAGWNLYAGVKTTPAGRGWDEKMSPPHPTEWWEDRGFEIERLLPEEEQED